MTAPNPTTRLDVATKLDRSCSAVYRPRVKEHSVQVIRVRNPAPEEQPFDRVPDVVRSRAEAQRRASVQVRRWCAENRITRLVTLTFRESIEVHEEVVRAVRSMVRRLRRADGSLRYIYVLEWHPSGHGLHVHMGVDRWIPKAQIAECWARGFVDVRRIETRRARGRVGAERACARYLAKYVTKAEDAGRLLGRHRYERSQGGSLTEERIECDSWDAAVAWLHAKIKGPVVWSWQSSDDDETWLGPRTLCLWE